MSIRIAGVAVVAVWSCLAHGVGAEPARFDQDANVGSAMRCWKSRL
jgi:hypothetical protein